MALDEELSSFIGRLYEAVYDPVAWHRLIGELLERTGSHLAFITTVDVVHRELQPGDVLRQGRQRFREGHSRSISFTCGTILVADHNRSAAADHG